MTTPTKKDKHASKRKAALAAIESDDDHAAPAATPMQIEQIDGDDDEEESKSERKKAKKEKPAKAAAAAVAAPAAKSKAEQLRELMASMTEEEKKEAAPTEAASSSQAMVPIAAAASSSQAVVPRKQILMCTIEESEEYTGPARSWMELFNESCRVALPKVRFGTVRAWHPDQAVLLYFRNSGNKMHVLDFQRPEDIKQIKVKREEEKKPKKDEKGKKVWLATGTTYVNFWGEFDQRWDGQKMKGLHLLTPFGSGAYGKVGPTVETGIEGDRGREFDGTRKNDSESSIGIAISNAAWTHLAKNPETYKNPVMETAVRVMKDITLHAATTLFAIPGSLPGWNAHHKDDIEDMNKKEKLAFLFKSKAFKGKTGHDDDTNTDNIKASLACLRKTRPTYKGDVRIDEDISGYTPPSELYEKIRVNDDGHVLLHNRIRVFRCRRADEVEEGKSYDSPFIEIPFENAVISSYHDVFAIGYSVNIYEWKQKTADVTHKIMCLIWLNTKEALEGMEAASIQTCDPRYAVPMAGHYVGLDSGPAGTVTADGSVSFLPDPDHPAAAAAAGFASN